MAHKLVTQTGKTLHAICDYAKIMFMHQVIKAQWHDIFGLPFFDILQYVASVGSGYQHQKGVKVLLTT